MKTFAIVIRDYALSEQGFNRLVTSSEEVKNDFTINIFDAIVPDQTDDLMKQFNLEWTWPWSGTKYDEKSKIKMHAYGGTNPKRRIACSLSHFILWKQCSESNEPFLILEHDALFIRKLDCEFIINSKYGAVGLNDQKNATRKPDVFHSVIWSSRGENLVPCPIIDRMEVAQGIAGNSAYIIKPWAAKELIEKVYEYGMWPNDAIMCQQIVPWLGVTKLYYTKVQGLRSTTSSIS